MPQQQLATLPLTQVMFVAPGLLQQAPATGKAASVKDAGAKPALPAAKDGAKPLRELRPVAARHWGHVPGARPGERLPCRGF